MDHEVVSRPCKKCDWLLNSSHDHFGLHQGKNVRMTREFEVPKRHILGPTLSTDMVKRVLRWERQSRCYGRKRQGPIADKYYCNGFWMNYFWEEKMKTKEDKNNGQTFKIALFELIWKKKHIHFLVRGHSSWSTFGLHLVRSPKAL